MPFSAISWSPIREERMSEFEQTGQSQERSASRLIRLKEVQHRVGLSRSTIYKHMAEGSFPKARSIGRKCSVWVEEEIEHWIAQIADRESGPYRRL